MAAQGKATLGSTSYDGADAGPFEPDWGGASWYGTTSGTYWTINPKEYADPRKHGPEYQARARRTAGGRASPGSGRCSAAGPDPLAPPDPYDGVVVGIDRGPRGDRGDGGAADDEPIVGSTWQDDPEPSR